MIHEENRKLTSIKSVKLSAQGVQPVPAARFFYEMQLNVAGLISQNRAS